MTFNAASFLIRTLTVGAGISPAQSRKTGVADCTAGMEFHHSPKIVYCNVLNCISAGAQSAPAYRHLFEITQ